MSVIDLITDPYNQRARLQPTLVAILPIFLVGLLFYLEMETRAATFLTTLAYFGGMVLLTQLGRDRGKKIEPRLFDAWGGKPSVVFLRRKDNQLNSVTKSRYHEFLQKKVSNIKLPSQKQEEEDPRAADDMYQTASDWLLSKTRDMTKFRLIFEENMNYGFRRNLYALKPIALLLDFVVGAGVLVVTAARETIFADDLIRTLAEIDGYIYISFAALILHTLAMIFIVTKAWVKKTADAYAQQLLSACDSL